jgi:hypothetical protein
LCSVSCLFDFVKRENEERENEERENEERENEELLPQRTQSKEEERAGKNDLK